MSDSSTLRENLTPFTLVPMTAEHLEAVVEIEQVGFSNPWQKRDFEYAMSRAGSWCVVAVSSGELVGYSVGFRVGQEFHFADFAIHPGLQRRGIGRELLRQVLGVLHDRNTSVVTLEVRASNQRALRLYGRSGFSTVAVRNGYYSKPREDALVMMKALEGRLSDWVGEVMGTMSSY